MFGSKLAVLAVVLGLAGSATAAPKPAQNILKLLSAHQDSFSVLSLLAQFDKDLMGIATDSQSTMTVFAPTDTAFINLLVALNITNPFELLGTERLSRMLAYHVIPGAAVKTTDLLSRQVIQTSLHGKSGKVLIYKGPGGVRLLTSTKPKGVSRVLRRLKNLSAGNAIVHGIDTVLVPA